MNMMAPIRIFIIIFLVSTIHAASAQSAFQKNRKSFQGARYNNSTKRVGNACGIFAKRNKKADKKPIINFGFRRKSKSKGNVAEQN